MILVFLLCANNVLHKVEKIVIESFDNFRIIKCNYKSIYSAAYGRLGFDS